MGLPKGRTNNPTGRKRGSKNKITSDLKTFVSDLMNDNRAIIVRDLKRLEPKDRLTILERLMAYVLPKQQTIDVKTQLEEEYRHLENLISNLDDEALDKLASKVEYLTRLRNEQATED